MQDRSRCSDPGLVQPATIKANSHVANITPAPPSSQNATPPVFVLIILFLLFVGSGQADNRPLVPTILSVRRSMALVL
jgi:hypothetical protein